MTDCTDKTFYVVDDGIANGPYLAYTIKAGRDMWAEDMYGRYKIDRVLTYKQLVYLPTKYETNYWALYEEGLPTTPDIYTPSDAVLTYDIITHRILECCWWPIEMCWIDAESMGFYDSKLYKPTHWQPIPKRQK